MKRERLTPAISAMLVAGVPADKIKTGVFGDTQTHRDRRVEVLFAPANN